MSAAVIAQLIIALGPPAIEVIQKLIAVWSKDKLTSAEVLEICSVYKKTYEEFRAAATPTVPPTAAS